MEEIFSKKANKNKWLKLYLKIAISGICLWYVFSKLDFKSAGEAIKNANLFYLIIAFLTFVLSKIISALRLNIYFRNIDILLNKSQNLKLYWLGMFYNLLLPGSVSGDAYKILYLTKRFNVSFKKTTTAIFLDRISGLMGLGLILSVYAIIVLKNNYFILLIVLGTLLSVLLLYSSIKFWIKDFIPSFFPTLVLGIAVQIVQVVCVYFLISALHMSLLHTKYIFIFLVSSIVSVLPFTIGGLGAREVVFLQGSHYFQLTAETAVVISLLFYLINLATASFGMIYVFKDPFDSTKKNVT